MALFPRWSNAAYRWSLLLLLISVVAIPLALMGWIRTPYAEGRLQVPEQPVPFDHRHHVRDDGIDCRYCHSTVETSAYAGVPPTETCMGCHSQIWQTSPLLEPVRRSYYEGDPIEWHRVHRLPDFVFFNHAIHVRNGVGCESCHGRVDLMARVYQVEPLTMGWCLECHRDPAPHLRPRSKVTVMGWTPAAPEETGEHIARLYDVDPGTDCTSCHR